MSYPLISEYIEAIKEAEDNFATLTNLRPVFDEDGNPIMSNGNFAVVFKMQDIETKEYFAVKCFTREQEGRETAYQKIAEALININSPYLVPLRYYNDELYVYSSQTDNTDFPVVLMKWVEGENLENYISTHINDVYAIHHIFGAFVNMAIWLLQQPFAHGDLKPDNIMIRQDGTIVLVDYDGMFIPSMMGEASREMGSPDFRHPQREKNEFNDNIDVFAITAIALSLSYMAKRSQSDLTKSILFLSEQDHVRPAESKLLNAILKNSVGTVCGKILSLYQLVLSDRYIQKSVIVSILLSFFNNDTNVTDFDLNNSFSIGHIRYSFDGRKILKVPCDYEWINFAFEIQQGVEILCNESLQYIEDNSIFVIPNSLSIIGDNVFPYYVRRFISDSPNFISNEYGLFSADYKEFIKSHESSKTILRLFPQTTTIRDYACIPTWDFRFSFVERDSNFYRLNQQWNGKIISLEPIGDLFEDSYGAVYTKDKKSLLYFPINSKLKEYSIIDGCETIKEGAFDYYIAEDDSSAWIKGNCIETLHFPKSLQRIELNGILGCIDLRCIFVDIYSEEHFVDLLKHYEEQYYGSRRIPLNHEVIIFETNDTPLDYENSFLDEYGFRYTNDGLKLLSANDTESLYNIREGVKIVCDNAFYLIDCPNLRLPNSLVSIGNYAFCDCSFENIEVPPNVKSIGSDAFMGEALKSITIKGNVRFMGTCVFSPDDNGSRLEKVELCEGVLALGDLTFKGCYNLTTIELPSTLLSIGDNPFANSGIRNFTNKSKILKVKNCCIYDKWSYKLISYIGTDRYVSFDNLSEIGNYAFAWNSILTRITIPNGTKHIGNHAFSGCKNLLSVDIPKSVISIGKCAFQSCYSLEKLSLPNYILQLNELTFDVCSSLSYITLPMYLTSIKKRVFSDCRSLRELRLPKYLSEIIGNPFERDYNGQGVCSITCESNKNFFVYDGGLYHCQSKTLITILEEHEKFHIKEGTKFIGEYAFHYSQNIVAVDTPVSLTIIGDAAFWGCKKLQSIILRENIRQIYHPYSTFEFCENLEHIYVENNENLYQLLYNSNKEYRKKLKKLEITTVLPEDLSNLISSPGEEYKCYDENNRIVRFGYNYVDCYKIYDGTKVICDHCFFDEYNEIDGFYLSKLYIPDSVEFIGNNPFCRSIEDIICDSPHFTVENQYLMSKDRKKIIFYFGNDRDIIIPNGVEIIGGGAFCSLAFETLTIPSSVREIGDNPFINCAATFRWQNQSQTVTNRIISHSQKYIVRDCMLIDTSCNRIISYWGLDKNLTIPPNIVSIGANAFFNAGIETIILHSNIEFVDETAFYWCLLKKIIVPKGKKYDFERLLMSYIQDYISEE